MLIAEICVLGQYAKVIVRKIELYVYTPYKIAFANVYTI